MGTPYSIMISPSSGVPEGGQHMTITSGGNFDSTYTYTIQFLLPGVSPAQATNVAFVDTSTLTCTTPSSRNYVGNVQVEVFDVNTFTTSFCATYTYNIPCLCRGMWIDTPQGPRTIEALTEGDFVCPPPSHDWSVPILHMFCQTLSGNPDNLPYRIPKNFFEHEVPDHDILLSPHHAIFYHGEWQLPCRIPGLQKAMEYLDTEFEYYHIHLPDYAHDKLWCHNLPVDSWNYVPNQDPEI
jgi:hypothetical protein